MRFIVIVTDLYGDRHCYGVYRSFKRADGDARAQRDAIVMPVEPVESVGEHGGYHLSLDPDEDPA